MTEKIGVVNQAPVHNQTNTVTIIEGQKTKLVYSDPLPSRAHFQGRKPQLEDLNHWLTDSAVQMIGIRGEGGIGKSTLAAKAFADCLGFAGKCWLDVRTGTSITEVAERALQEFGMTPEQMQAIPKPDLPQRLLRTLQTGRFLLAIDNLESVLHGDGTWQIGYEEFLDGFQTLGSESVVLLAGREYPPKYFGWLHSQWLSVAQGLEPMEGAGLLAALEAEGTEAERAAVSVQVDGNPLVLALLAGWLREEYRPGERTVQHLTTQPDLWQIEGKHRGEQQISLERVFEWSFNRLTDAQQHLLSQICVLRGAFNTEAASAVADRPVSDADLHDLERRSLLQELPERDQHGLKPYRLQPRIQSFAQKRAGDVTEVHQRAIAHFWNQRQPEFAPTADLTAASEYLETVYHQVCLERYQDAATTAFTCAQFLYQRGYYSTLVELYSQLHTNWHPTAEEQPGYGAVCILLGDSYCSLGQYHRAIEFNEQALAIARAIGSRSGEAQSLCGLGNAYLFLRQYQRASEFHEQSLTIARAIGSRGGEGKSLLGLGNAYLFLEQFQRTIKFYEQALTIQREVGDRVGEADSLLGLGNVYQFLGQFQRAIEFHEQALAIAQEIGDRGGEANYLLGLGNSYFSLGQFQRAIEFFEQALAIKQDIGDRGGEANAMGNLGNAYHALGQNPRAIDSYEQALAIKQNIGDRHGAANAWFNLGIAKANLGELEAAIPAYQRARELYAAMGIGYWVEQCDEAIREVGQVIAMRQRVAPTIGDPLPAQPDWHAKSLPSSPKSVTASKKPQTSSRISLPLWLWFAVGLAGVVLVWWVKSIKN